MHLDNESGNYIQKRFMKKILLLLGVLCIIITSCSIDNGDKLKFHVEFLPVVSVEIPETMQPGGTYEFKVTYSRPTDCYYFDGFYYEPEGNANIVAVQTLVIEDADCQPLTTLAPEVATFQVSCSPDYTASTYFFKFYQGEDADGNQQFMEVYIPVQ